MVGEILPYFSSIFFEIFNNNSYIEIAEFDNGIELQIQIFSP